MEEFTISKASAHEINKPATNNERLILAFTFSLLLHLSFVFILTNKISFKPAPKKIFNIQIAPSLSKKKQIVSPSDQINKIVPQKESFISEENNTVLNEQVKRGDNQKESPAPQIQAKTKNITKTTKTDSAKLQTENNLAKALAGTASIGKSGIQDHLPDIKGGEITLLNTKAQKYAGFVRRVANQVFSEIKFKISDLPYSEDQRINNVAEVFAYLDPNGNLRIANLQKNSGSEIFNTILLSAVKSKARDPHPPKSALTNNQYHFIFQTELQSSRIPNNGPKGFSIRRYLILRVGLK